MTFKTGIEIRGDSSGAERAVGSAVRSLDQLEAKAILSEKALAGLNGVIAGSAGKFAAIAGGVAIFAGLAEVTKSVIEHTIEAQRSQALLTSAILASGNATGLTRAELNGLAESLSKTSVFSTDAVVSAEALMLRYKNMSGEVLPRATSAAVDMASALGIDLTQATQLVGKAMQDPLNALTALRREGITFTEAQKNQIQRLLESGRVSDAQSVILRELESRYKGAAAAARDNFGGALAGLKNQLGDLLTAKGGMPDATQSINDLTATLQDPKVKDGIDTLVGGISTALSKLVELGAASVRAIKGAAEAAAYVASGDAAKDVKSQVQTAGNYLGAVAGGPFAMMSYAYAGGGAAPVASGEEDAQSASLKATSVAAAAAKSALHDFGDEEQKLYEKLLPLVKLQDDHRLTLVSLKAQLAAGKITLAEYSAEVGEENRQYAERRKSLDSYAKQLAEQAKFQEEAYKKLEESVAAVQSVTDAYDPASAALTKFNAGVAKLSALGPPDPGAIRAYADAFAEDLVGGLDAASVATRKYEGDVASLEMLLDQGFISPDRFEELQARAKATMDDIVHGSQGAAAAVHDSLGEAFSDLKNTLVDLSSEWGKAAAQIVNGLERVVKSEQDIVDARDQMAKLNPKDKDYNEKRLAFEKVIAKLEDQRLEKQLGGYGALADGAQNFFKEGSAGYKTLGALSQAFHAAELAMTLARTGPEAVLALVKSLQAPPPVNFISYAAVAAILAGLGVAIAGVGGGGGGGDLSDQLAENRQKTQGTGSVLGDAAAQSKSIADSLDGLKNISDKGLSYSSLMLEQLRAINAGINGFGSLLYRQNGGVTPLAGFQETKTSGFFGGSSSNLADTGISFDPSQLIGSILSGAQTLAQFYADIHNHEGSFLGISNSDSIDRQTQALDAQTQSQVDQIIKGLGSTIFTSVQTLGGDVDQARALLDNADLGHLLTQFDLSLKDLKGDDLNKAISAFFSQLGDAMVEAALPAIKQFQQVGEGLMETLVRVSSETYALTHAMTDLGIAFAGLEWLQRAQISEQLIALAGGLDNLASGISTFIDKFFSDQEKADMAASQFGSALGDLGIAVPATREAFKQLVQGLDLTTAAGQQAFVTLTGLAQVADQYYSAISDAQQAVLDAADRQRQAISDQADAAISALQAQKAALKDQASSLSAVISKWQQLADSLRSFAISINGLIVGHSANATAALQGQFGSLVRQAGLGNQNAMQELPGVGQALSQQILATAHTREEAIIKLADVRNQALAAAATAQRQESIAQQQLDALTAQQDTLDAQIQAEKDWRDAQMAALDAQLTALGLINSSELTVAQAVAQLVALQQHAQEAAQQAAAPPPAANDPTGGSTAPGDGSAAGTVYRDRIGPGTPRYADGGYHSGGARIVGEMGPELEVTGPSGILSASSLLRVVAGNERHTRALVEEVRMLRAEMQATAKASVKTAKILDRVSLGGTSLQTTAAA